jgi:GMP synthase-like glutamine amidotransferase
VSRALFLQHGDWGPPGLLGEWAAARGIALDVHHAKSGAPLPALNGQAFVASLGSPHNPGDTDVAEVADELAFLQEAVARDVPVLGLCFGGQALAATLGGEVRAAAAPEIGWLELESLDGGAVAPGPWFAWHEDTFTLPPGAVELARSPACPHAFRVGRSVGLQFHPEVTPEIVEGWVRGGRDTLTENRIDGEAIRAQTRAGAAAHRARAFALFDAIAEGWTDGRRTTVQSGGPG